MSYIQNYILSNPPTQTERPNAYYKRIGAEINKPYRRIQKNYRQLVKKNAVKTIGTQPDIIKQHTTAKVLVFDIETTPICSYTFDVWKQNIMPVQIVRPWNMICWSAKWLFGSEIYSDVMTPEEAIAGDDSRITKSLWAYIEEADILIAHNGVKFDVPKINSRFLVHGLPPPKPYLVIDTCLAARKKFGFEHNKLDYLAERLGVPRKLDTDFQLWIDCMLGKEESLAFMCTYNQHDVVVLEEVYVKLRSWIPLHPNMGFYVDAENGGSICPICGGTHLEYAGYYSTPINQYKSFRCIDCGAIGRSRNTNIPIKKKQQLLHPQGR